MTRNQMYLLFELASEMTPPQQAYFAVELYRCDFESTNHDSLRLIAKNAKEKR